MKIKEYSKEGIELAKDRLTLRDNFEKKKTEYQKGIEYNVTKGRGYGILPSDDLEFRDSLQAWLFFADNRKKFNTSELSAYRRINFEEYTEKFHTLDRELYDPVFGKMDKDKILLIDFLSAMKNSGNGLLGILKELYGAEQNEKREVVQISKHFSDNLN